MRKTVITLLALGMLVATASFAANDVRISQVYYGGGAATGYYNSDYVELFNNSGAAIDMSGWQLQYGSATGLFASNTFTIYTFPAGTTIQPCSYFLIATGTVNGLNALPVTPDLVNTLGPSMSGSAGKVALCPVGTATGLACAAMLPLKIDLFGWGTATCYEGAAAMAAQNYTGVATRNGGGTIDTDVNTADFTNLTAPVTIHNSASGQNAECLVVPTSSRSWGQIKTMYR